MVRTLFPLLVAILVGAAPAQQPPRSLVGYVRTVDFVTAEGAVVRLRGTRASTEVGADGRFALPLDALSRDAEIAIFLSGYHTAVLPLEDDFDVGTVLLVPERWRIATGVHAGLEVEIDLTGATGGNCRGCGSFYGEVLGDERSVLSPGIPTWPPTAFPLEVAFDRENGGRISPADSVSFWRVVRSLEDHFGLRLFRPAPLSTVLANVANDGPGSLLVMVDPGLPSTGWGSAVAQSGDILAGAVHFRSARTFAATGAPEVVTHEIFHALGFGHTCAWPSIVADVRQCRGRQTSAPTAEDVAHAQLLWRIRDLEREARVSNTVEAAVRGSVHSTAPLGSDEE